MKCTYMYTGLVVSYIRLMSLYVPIVLIVHVTINFVAQTTVYYVMKTEKNRYYRGTWPRSKDPYMLELTV